MEKFISELKNTADKVAKKSSELVELSKVKLAIATTKSEIGANYKTLGELVYLSQKNEFDGDTGKIEEAITKINELHERLEELTGAVSALKNEKICPDCSKSSPSDAAFCAECGYNFSATEEDDTDEAVEIEIV